MTGEARHQRFASSEQSVTCFRWQRGCRQGAAHQSSQPHCLVGNVCESSANGTRGEQVDIVAEQLDQLVVEGGDVEQCPLGLESTRRSMSDSAPALPWATDPNTRGLVAP